MGIYFHWKIHCLTLNLLSTAVLGTISFLRLLKKQKLSLLPFFFFFFSLLFFRNNGKFRAIRYFMDPQTANTVQLFVAMKGHYFGLFFFRTNHHKREFYYTVKLTKAATGGCCPIKKAVPKNFTMFTGKYLCRSFFFL